MSLQETSAADVPMHSFLGDSILRLFNDTSSLGGLRLRISVAVDQNPSRTVTFHPYLDGQLSA